MDKQQGFFKRHIRKFRPTYAPETLHKYVEFQCPVCKRWFTSYRCDGWDTMGVRLHISKIGKSEMVAKGLGETKKTPHFDFWKKHTQPVQRPFAPREWNII